MELATRLWERGFIRLSLNRQLPDSEVMGRKLSFLVGFVGFVGFDRVSKIHLAYGRRWRSRSTQGLLGQ